MPNYNTETSSNKEGCILCGQVDGHKRGLSGLQFHNASHFFVCHIKEFLFYTNFSIKVTLLEVISSASTLATPESRTDSLKKAQSVLDVLRITPHHY